MPDINRIAKVFLKIRDARSKLAEEYKKADQELCLKQERLETEMLKFLQDNNTNSTRTDVATIIRQEDLVPACADWDALYKWIRDNDAFDILERRIKKSFVNAYMEDNKNDLPPGVSAYRRYVVRVRRNS